MLKILLTDSLGNTAKYALVEDADTSFVLGRAEDCDIVLGNDGTLSRYHAIVRYEQGHWVIRDNNSVNGIRLGRLPVMQATLTGGTRITIGGGTTLEVLTTVTAPAAAPAESAEAAPAPAAAPALAESAEAAPAADVPAPVPAPPKAAAKKSPAQRRSPAAPPRPEPRAVKRAGGKRKAAPRRLAAVEEVEQPVGRSAEALGLPHDFSLQFFLAEPRHAVTAGSVLRFGFMAEEDCFLYLVQHDSMGGISLILPTQEGEVAELHARRATALPPKSFLVSDELVVGPPFGLDTIVAVACEQPCAFAAHLNALLAEEHSAEPGDIERLVLDRCDADLPEGAVLPRRSSAVLSLETKA